MKHICRIGLFGIGLEAYWPQFKGLKPRLENYVRAVEQKLSRPGVEVVNLGLIDNPKKALEAGHQFRAADVDVIFLHVTTYALSSTVLPVVQRAKVPVIILNLAPAAAIDYARFNALGDRTAMTGEWLAHCAACPVPEIANVFSRAGIDFHQVTGMLDDDPVCWNEVDAWIEAARVAHTMFHNRLGWMGHYYGGMLDMASTRHCNAPDSLPGPILEVGNTNSRYRFSIGARRFVNEWNVQGPAHHCAVGVRHVANKIRKLGLLLGLEAVSVC